MIEIDKSNHGLVGEVLYIRISEKKLMEFCRDDDDIEDIPVGVMLNEDEISKRFSITSSIPFFIDNNTKGDYEVVCEFGVEVHNFNEVS